MRFFNKLRFKIALMAGLLLAGLSFVTLFLVSQAIDRQSTDAIRAELGNTQKVFQGLLKERENSMKAQAFVLADSVQFKTALDLKSQDPATTADVAQEKKNELGLDLFQVAGRKGALLASTLPPTTSATSLPVCSLSARANVSSMAKPMRSAPSTCSRMITGRV